MSKIYYYVLLNRNGNLITTGSHLPIYLNKEVAEKLKISFRAYEIKRINIEEFRTFINFQK